MGEEGGRGWREGFVPVRKGGEREGEVYGEMITSHVFHYWVPGRHPEIDAWPPRGPPPHRSCTLLCRSCDFSLHTTSPERYALHMARVGGLT